MTKLDKNATLESLAQWNFWDRDQEVGVWRESYLSRLEKYLFSEQVILISGVRRSGKSFILRQAAKRLIEGGRDRKDIIIINFEDPRLSLKDARDLEEVYKAIVANLGRPGQKWIFLDEVGLIEGWEQWVRMMHELRKAKIVVSGSNSNLLSRELGTKLTGRHLDLVVYPLSLSEFVKFKAGEEAEMYLRSYLQQGGFPLAVLEPQIGRELILSYFDDILRRDVAGRYQIRKEVQLRELAKYVVGNYANLVTYGGLAKFLNLSDDVVKKYLTYMQEAYLVGISQRFSFKPKLVEKSPRKVYCIDSGMADLVGVKSDRNWGRLAENTVYWELLRRGKQVFYWKDDLHREIDFVVREESGQEAIQVCWDLKDAKTKAREMKSLLLGLADLGLKEGTILTEDHEGDEVVSGKVIKYRKLADWLMGKSYEDRD